MLFRSKARASLEGWLTVHAPIDFGGKLRWLGHRVSSDTVAPKEQLTLSLGVVATEPMMADYHITVTLEDELGNIVHEQEHDLDGGARGTSAWEPGRWLFRSFLVMPEEGAAVGEYRLRVSIVDPKTGRALRPRLPPDGPYPPPDENSVLTVATIWVE